MANSAIHVPRGHLIMALCVPLAVLLGFFLAEPFDQTNMAPVVMVVGLLSVPLMMKWHHPLLIASWNASIVPAFIRGQLWLWMLMAAASLLVAVLNRAVDPGRRFLNVPSLLRPLIFFAVVVVGTGCMTGGVGVRMLGSAQFGGKGYLFLLLAIVGYVALTSDRIPVERAWLYLGLFFLPACTTVIGDIVPLLGRPFDLLYALFPPPGYAAPIDAGLQLNEMVKFGGLAVGGTAVQAFLMARYGLRDIFSTPLRLLLFLLAGAACFCSGFRLGLFCMLMTFGCVFCLDGLWRTRALPIVLGCTLVGSAVLLPLANHMPLVVQRSLCFLPLKLDPAVREDAQHSTEWRQEMWDRLWPEVPKYLIKGKGYAINSGDLYFAQESAWRGIAPSFETAMVAGNYHNGPLTVIIPFGILGAFGFVWFLLAGLHALYCNYRFGDPVLHNANTVLLATFIVKVLVFLFIFGSLSSEFYVFTGLAGLSVSLNGGVARRSAPEDVPEPERELMPVEAL